MVKIAQELKESPTLKVSDLAKRKMQKGERIISMGRGEPIFDTPKPILEATFKALKDGYTKYSNPFGLMEIRELIKTKLSKENGIETSVENIIVTPGAKQALLLTLMALLEPFDEILNITPCYVSYIPQIKIAEPTAVIHNIGLKKEDFSLDWEKIEILMKKKTKVIILNFPHNPTGQILPKQDIKKFIKIIADYNCYVISDEIYEKLIFSNIPYYSLGSFREIENRVVTINGFSKAFSMTGWRIGYLAGNPNIIKIISRLQQHMNTNTCTFVQKGACAAFSLSADHIIRSYNKELLEKVSFMLKIFKANKKLRLISPKGGLFAFLNISNTGLNSDEFAYHLLLKKGVIITPGISFGENWDDHVRIALVAGKEEFEEGIRLISQFTEEI